MNSTTSLRDYLAEQFHSVDVIVRDISDDLAVCYLPELVNMQLLNKFVLSPLLQMDDISVQEKLTNVLPIGEIQHIQSHADALPFIIKGWCYIVASGIGVVVNIAQLPQRSLVAPENEAALLGSKLAFTESIETNTALLRSSICNTDLCNEKFIIGNKRNTVINLMFIADRVNGRCMDQVRRHIRQLQHHDVTSSVEIMHMLQDNDMSVFPQMVLTERVDLASHSLLEGKVIIIVNGSPLVIIAPSEFIDFFLSTEDRYLGWMVGTFVRSLRVVALFISILLTPAYVAALTFHYEVIPSPLLLSLVESRSRVPFPPLFEALILELTMELLREAGVRLPTKIGQTIGIVGGIVIGQAAVQAGFTSNILIMLVALAAIGSFTSPEYLMSGSLRLIRYPIIIFAGIWGNIGILFVTFLIFVHLMRQTSLGRPYFTLIPLLTCSHPANNNILLPEPKGLTAAGHSLRKLFSAFRLRSLWTGSINNELQL